MSSGSLEQQPEFVRELAVIAVKPAQISPESRKIPLIGEKSAFPSIPDAHFSPLNVVTGPAERSASGNRPRERPSQLERFERVPR
jgi:hypothetical protein